MKLSYCKYFLGFRHPFSLSGLTRKGTDTVIIRMDENGMTGYGEATLPPYLSETTEIVVRELDSFFNNISHLNNPVPEDFPPFLPDRQLFPATCCAIEEALLQCFYPEKLNVKLSSEKIPYCTFTIGIGNEQEDEMKIEESKDFKILKIKLGRRNDIERITRIRSLTDKTLCVDLNQGYSDRNMALKLTKILADIGVTFIEQPFHKDDLESHLWLKDKKILPVIADESIQNSKDLDENGTYFDGINVKLIKCGGMTSAKHLLNEAGNRGMMKIIGCMSESSCGIFHASSLQHLADVVDLDGPWLINNDPFTGVSLVNGKIRRDELKLNAKMEFIEL